MPPLAHRQFLCGRHSEVVIDNKTKADNKSDEGSWWRERPRVYKVTRRGVMLPLRHDVTEGWDLTSQSPLHLGQYRWPGRIHVPTTRQCRTNFFWGRLPYRWPTSITIEAIYWQHLQRKTYNNLTSAQLLPVDDPMSPSLPEISYFSRACVPCRYVIMLEAFRLLKS